MRRKIPQELLDRHPDLTRREIIALSTLFLSSRNKRVRQGYILDFKIPYLGRFKSHGNKKTRRMKGTIKADRKRKRELAIIKQFKKENLLW